MPVIPLAMWWGPRRPGGRGSAAPLLLLGTMAVCIAPWTIRNAIVMDSFIPVATNPSTTLWSGHNPDANGGPTYAPPELLARIPPGLSSPEHEVAEAHLLRTEAIHWAVRNPHKELGLIPRRLLALNTGDRLALTTWSNAPGAREVHTSGLTRAGRARGRRRVRRALRGPGLPGPAGPAPAVAAAPRHAGGPGLPRRQPLRLRRRVLRAVPLPRAAGALHAARRSPARGGRLVAAHPPCAAATP